jgi:hypothetical protein
MSGAKRVSYGAIGGETRGWPDLQTNKAIILSLSKHAPPIAYSSFDKLRMMAQERNATRRANSYARYGTPQR